MPPEPVPRDPVPREPVPGAHVPGAAGPREIGSEFHWDAAVPLDAERGGLPRWVPQRRALFATGCGALTAVLRALAPTGRLHVPSYFCMGVAETIAERVPIAWYRHLPDGRGPHWGTLRARDGDVVLAQNLFARDEPAPWAAWIEAHPGIPVIEDHSHDPFSAWAAASTAAYVVASLRKTLPLPDGGLVWSPRGLALPEPHGPQNPGAPAKLAAMLLKGAWLHGQPIDKDRFRALQQQGERELLGHAGPACSFTVAALPLLDVAGLREAGARAVRELTGMLSTRTPEVWVSSPGPAPDGAAPFRLQLRCAAPGVRDQLIAHLARAGIFAPVHWRQERGGSWSGDHEAAELAGRMLTLPVDHRCDVDDLRRIADVVRAFAPGRGSRGRGKASQAISSGRDVSIH